MTSTELPKAEALRSAQPPIDRLNELARSARAFSDPTRLAITIALRDGEQPASAIWGGCSAATRSSSPTTRAN